MAASNSDHHADDDASIADRASQIIEADRASLGNEIHDDLLPLIFVASASASRLKSDPSISSPETRGRIEQIDAWLVQAMQAGRRLLTNAYPPELTGSAWVREAIDTVHRLFPDSNVTIDWQLDPNVNEIPKPTAIACYRIVIEAIRNSLRHANPRNITVCGKSTVGDCRVEIVDDGDGFDPNAVPASHFGIRAMRARSELIGGRLEIESRIGGPTRVSLEFPIHP